MLLKSGIVLDLHGRTSDVGSQDLRIVVEDPRQGLYRLQAQTVGSVHFEPCGPDAVSSRGARLYGVVTTRGGQEFTGFVARDRDEVFTTDSLDFVDQVGGDPSRSATSRPWLGTATPDAV